MPGASVSDLVDRFGAPWELGRHDSAEWKSMTKPLDERAIIALRQKYPASK